MTEMTEMTEMVEKKAIYDFDQYSQRITKEVSQQIFVFCTLQFEGTHAWPECPYDDVSFLRNEHRHLFHIKAWAQVNHNDRDKEFILLKRNIQKYLNDKYPDGKLGRTSCEALAQELIQVFDLSACELSEDGENGAYVANESRIMYFPYHIPDEDYGPIIKY